MHSYSDNKNVIYYENGILSYLLLLESSISTAVAAVVTVNCVPFEKIIFRGILKLFC